MSISVDNEHLRQLREAAAEELVQLVDEHAAGMDVAAVRMVLRNSFVSTEIIERLMKERRLLAIYELRRDLARHNKTPQVHSMRLIPTLFWRDLMEIGLDMRAPPLVRRGAERHLVARVSSLAVGERMSIGRRAGHGVIMHLRFDSDSRVIGALLDNPRLNEGLLMPLVSHEGAPPEVLKTVAGNRRWGRRYPIRVALVRNPRTPPVIAVGLLGGLKKMDQKAVAQDVRLPTVVRRRARLLLGDPAESRNRLR
ncbi:MAG: hypothetical protein K0U98_12275 [Deltaproteobacteria bacterium]|nr:hypothetical protein [Deltaproteobacteria bacterium]